MSVMTITMEMGMEKMNSIAPYLENVSTVGIAGHVNPDGDCIGSTLGMYLYLKENYPEISVDLYLEAVKPEFSYLTDIKDYKNTCDPDVVYDLFITLDVSAVDRIGVAANAFAQANKTICIDHHISNLGFAQVNYIEPDSSSTCETLYTLFEEDKVSKQVAEAIYTGIVHDSGVFQYSCTGPRTMEIAGKLIAMGLDFTKIIDESFNQRTYLQQQILGRTLMESLRLIDGKCIAGIVSKKELDFYGVDKQDLGGIVSQLRMTKGVEVAIFLYEIGPQEFKVSMRSNSYVDVNFVASQFGGGGHVRASGCTMHGSPYDVINNLTYFIAPLIEADHD